MFSKYVALIDFRSVLIFFLMNVLALDKCVWFVVLCCNLKMMSYKREPYGPEVADACSWTVVP